MVASAAEWGLSLSAIGERVVHEESLLNLPAAPALPRGGEPVVSITLPPPPHARPANAPRPRTVKPSAVELALTRAEACLLGKQHDAGYWVGELQGDSILESEYLLMKFILGQEDDPELPLIANYLRSLQQPDGGWNMYPGGKADLSGTVKAYFALKLMGDDPAAPHMTRARDLIHSLGGAEKCNTFTKFF